MDKHNPIDHAVTKLDHTLRQTERSFATYRKTAFTRFPILFLLATTFGVVATYLGFERVIADILWLNDRPIIILLAGITTLILTGTLYKKLG